MWASPFAPPGAPTAPSSPLPGRPTGDPQYLEALLTEIDAAGPPPARRGKTVRAVYMGGGTPTTLGPPTSWPACWNGWAPPSPWPRHGVHRGGRPATPSPGEKLWPSGPGRQPDLREPQTMSDPVLAAIGRSHRAGDIRNGPCPGPGGGGLAHQHGPHRGPAGDTPQGFRQTLEEVMALAPENLTVHTLALKKGPPAPGGHPAPGTRWPPCWTTPGPPWRGGYAPTTSTGRSSCPAPWKTWGGPARLRQPVQHLHDGGAPPSCPWGQGVTKFVENGGSSGWPTPSIPRSTCAPSTPFARKKPPGYDGPGLASPPCSHFVTLSLDAPGRRQFQCPISCKRSTAASTRM